MTFWKLARRSADAASCEPLKSCALSFKFAQKLHRPSAFRHVGICGAGIEPCGLLLSSRARRAEAAVMTTRGLSLATEHALLEMRQLPVFFWTCSSSIVQSRFKELHVICGGAQQLLQMQVLIPSRKSRVDTRGHKAILSYPETTTS